MPTDARSAVEIEQVTRRFGDVTALDDVSLNIRQGEFFSLLGPSGCGKTTLLRIIAGLETPDAGRLRLGGLEAQGLPAHRRPVNTVFQSYALFPHLDVWGNVAFGLRMKRVPRPEVERRVATVLALVQIEGLAGRRPHELSGGQKQRVALARAIVNEPRVLLLDEPLAALDLKLRKQLQLELRGLQERLGITFIYVTHDQEEALVLSDRIAVMARGRIEQLDEARRLYERPRTRFVSQFLGSCTLLEGRLKASGPRHFVAATTLGELQVAGPTPPRPVFTLAIRPERVLLAAGEPESAANCVAVRVHQVRYIGGQTHYELQAGPQLLRAEAMNHGDLGGGLVTGQCVRVQLPAEALVVLDD